MTVKESFESRKMHITDEGTTLTQVFSAVADDWINADPAIPVIGDYWESRPDLIVTDVWLYWLDNINCRIEAVYSTKGGTYREKRADKTASVQENFNFSLTVDDAANYIDQLSEPTQPKIWAEVWAADHAANTKENVPPLSIYKPTLTFTREMYLSGWLFNTIADAIGTVNSSDWIKQTVNVWDGKRDVFYDITGDDTGKWLFSGYDASKEGDLNVKVIMEFTYSFTGWNKPHGVAANLYPTYDFNALPFPKDVNNKVDDTIRNV